MRPLGYDVAAFAFHAAAGFWRGSTEVAVKCFVTRPSGTEGECVGPPPAKALTEALLARDLAHPNIIRHVLSACLAHAGRPIPALH